MWVLLPVALALFTGFMFGWSFARSRELDRQIAEANAELNVLERRMRRRSLGL